MNNNYFLIRHGQARSNRFRYFSCWPEKKHNPLTFKGRRQAKKAAKQLANENINLIYSSDLLRTKQTAEIIAKKLKLDINFDKRLRERGAGVYNNKPMEEWYSCFKNPQEIFIKHIDGGENYYDLKKRLVDFITDVDNKHKGKKILIVSHGHPLLVLNAAIESRKDEDIINNGDTCKPLNAQIIQCATK